MVTNTWVFKGERAFEAPLKPLTKAKLGVDASLSEAISSGEVLMSPRATLKTSIQGSTAPMMRRQDWDPAVITGTLPSSSSSGQTGEFHSAKADAPRHEAPKVASAVGRQEMGWLIFGVRKHSGRLATVGTARRGKEHCFVIAEVDQGRTWAVCSRGVRFPGILGKDFVFKELLGSLDLFNLTRIWGIDGFYIGRKGCPCGSMA